MISHSVNCDEFFILDYFFGFLNRKEIQWSAIGTFEIILQSLLNKKGYETLYFLYEKKEVLQSLINHSYSLTMAELVQRVMNLTIPMEKTPSFLSYYKNK